MILTDSQIQEAYNNKYVLIEPFLESQIEPASYDLRVGHQGISTSSNKVINIKDKGFFELKPGDFGVILTRETLSFDASHTARIGLRSKFARKGIVATTGPQVDPGFKGRLKIGVINLSPHTIPFTYEDDLITLEVHSLTEPSKHPYSGKYQNTEGLTAEDIETMTEGENIGFSKMIDTMQSLSENVGTLTDDVKKYINKTDIIEKSLERMDRNLILGFSFVSLIAIFLPSIHKAFGI